MVSADYKISVQNRFAVFGDDSVSRFGSPSSPKEQVIHGHVSGRDAAPPTQRPSQPASSNHHRKRYYLIIGDSVTNLTNSQKNEHRVYSHVQDICVSVVAVDWGQITK